MLSRLALAKPDRLTVGPFRGFRNPESYDLTKRLILFYGPNGSGKTSLCEALEYAFTLGIASRHVPKAGAVCGNSARTDLCGGCR